MTIKIDQESIIWAYRLFLDREPENQVAIEDKLKSIKNTQQLRFELMKSNEFKEKNKNPELNYPKLLNQDNLTSINIFELSIEHLLNIAEQLEEQSKFDRAISYCKAALELNPDCDRAWIHLAKLYQANKEFTAAANCYQKAIEIDSTSNAEAYIYLGDVLSQQKQLDSTAIERIINVYEQAFQLESNLPISCYINLGNAYQKQGNLQKASDCYQKAAKAKTFDEMVYLELQNIQLKFGLKEVALETYKQWIEATYLVNHQYKFIYCPIAKNACTMLKNLTLELSDCYEDFQQSKFSIHEYIDRNKNRFLLDRFDRLQQPDYFKFIILRHPLKRIVSTYLDKFAKHFEPDIHALPVIEEVQNFLNIEPNPHRSITFSQFVDYLVRTEDRYLDPHWRPQYLYFGSGLFKFDLVGCFENLDRVITIIEKKIGYKIEEGVSQHRTSYGNFNQENKYAEYYPEQLRSLKAFPRSEQFYTPELEALVRSRYAEDIQLYKQEFDLTVTVS